MYSFVGVVLVLLSSPQLEQSCAGGEAQMCKLACNSGSAFGCVQYAKHQATGEQVRKDVVAAEKTLRAHCEIAEPKEEAARYNRALACGVLGSLVGAGIVGGKKDVPRSMGLFEKGCVGGDPLSCESLGGIYGGHDKTVRPDYAKALEWYEKGCALKNGRCCQMAGAIHGDGAAGKKNAVKAVEYFTAACDQDLAIACGMLARRFAHGDGVKGDLERAKKLNEKACRLGYKRACGG